MRDTAASLGLPMVVTYGSALQERIVCMRHSTDTDTTPLEVQIDLAHAFSMSPAAHTLCDKTGTLPGIRLTADASACTDVGFESPCSELSSPSVLAPDDSPSSIRHRLRAVMPSKEDFARNPHGPLLLTRNPLAPHQDVGGCSSPTDGVSFNHRELVPIDTPLFAGGFAMMVAGLPSTPAGEPAGKRCFQHIVFQGRLKRAVNAADLWTGHEWWFPPTAVPSSFSQLVFSGAAKMFSSTIRVRPAVDPATLEPAGILNPLLASAQLVNLSLPGEEPEPWEATEDCRLLSPSLADPATGAPLAPAKRRRVCDNPAALAGMVLQPGHVITLHIWQHWADLGSYQLDLGFTTVDLGRFLGRQPLQIMAKDTQSGDYVINLCMWHRHMLPRKTAEERQQDQDKAGGSLDGLKRRWKGFFKGSS